MKVVPASYIALVRARKDLLKAFHDENWSEIQELDHFLTSILNHAFDDPNRDHRLLAKELENILSLYSDMVKSLPPETIEAWQRPERVV